jgi:hypothetical protein
VVCQLTKALMADGLGARVSGAAVGVIAREDCRPYGPRWSCSHGLAEIKALRPGGFSEPVEASGVGQGANSAIEAAHGLWAGAASM